MEEAILVGPFLGEMYWECGRFATHIIWKKLKQYKGRDIKIIVFTRPDRFDMYGEHADILVPLRIEGDGTKYKGDCYRLIGFPNEQYKDLKKKFNKKYSERYEVIEHIVPDLKGKSFANKNQYSNRMVFNKFKPRKDNSIIINNNIPDDKPLITLAPRYREGMRRNWPYWNELYDLIYDSKLINKYNFVICGKSPDYIPDKENRFLDINNFQLTDNSSLIGLTIECLKRSFLTIGSQSGIPNISLLVGTKVLEWGHQRHLHTKVYNPFKTHITFLDDHKYNFGPDVIFNEIKKKLKEEK